MQNLNAFLQFYARACTRYQVHSPFVFEFVEEVLDDKRRYYAFRDIEHLRDKMLSSALAFDVLDLGAGEHRAPQHRRLGQIVRKSSSAPRQGRQLFRLANWLKPATVLELGASVGVGTLYLSAGAPQARVVALEGCPNSARVARTNLEVLQLRNAEVLTGSFDDMLGPVLEGLGSVDLVFFDGNHRGDATLRYFHACQRYAQAGSVFVFDDIYWSADMEKAWHTIRQHPSVTLSIDCFDLGFVFFKPNFKEKQHFRLVPWVWKPWKVF